MKRAKRFLAFILCLCTLTGLLTTTAFATTTLTKIRVTVDAPAVGSRPATTASLPSTARSAIQKVEWSGELNSDGTFKAGVKYTVTVTLGIKSGADCVFSSKSINATVNEKAAKEVLWYAKDKVQVIYTFPALSSKATVIDTIILTVDAPASGKQPATTAKLSAGNNGTVNSVVESVKWSGELDTDGTFMPRTKYTVTFTMGIKPGRNYIFSDKSIGATVNGKAADEVLWYSDDLVEVIYTFPAFSTGDVISKANITMDAPVVGDLPAREAHVPSTASTYVKSIRWEGPLDSSGRFQANTEYTAYLTLAMKSNGRIFSEKSFDAVVNGVTIDSVIRNSDTEIIIPVEFEKTPNVQTPTTPPATITTKFTDVPATAYYAVPVAWAVEKKITAGKTTTTFAPDETCTQAQILTFLWNAKGAPEPQGTMEITGISPGSYYYKASLWAAEQGILKEGDYYPEAPCTRAMAVMFLWKQAGSPSAPAASFGDVPADAEYAQAVAWAVDRGVTGGTRQATETTPAAFSPADTCTRGQIATFLYKAFAN